MQQITAYIYSRTNQPITRYVHCVFNIQQPTNRLFWSLR
jgi:hypothetical protein